MSASTNLFGTFGSCTCGFADVPAELPCEVHGMPTPAPGQSEQERLERDLRDDPHSLGVYAEPEHCPNHVLDEDGERVCACGDEGRLCEPCAAAAAAYWRTKFDEELPDSFFDDDKRERDDTLDEFDGEAWS